MSTPCAVIAVGCADAEGGGGGAGGGVYGGGRAAVGRGGDGGDGGVSSCTTAAVVLVAAFVVQCIVDGVSYSFAVFYVELLHEFPSESHETLVLVGTLMPATCLLVGQ